MIASYLGSIERFNILAGLVRLGSWVRSSVTPEMFQILAKSIGQEDLKMAAKISHMFDSEANAQLDTDRIYEHIQSLGEETIIAWRLLVNNGADRAKIDFALRHN